MLSKLLQRFVERFVSGLGFALGMSVIWKFKSL